MTRPSPLRLYALEAWYELVKVWRMPGYTIPALAFPLGFYALFAIALAPRSSGSLLALPAYLVATYGACGLMGAALQSFGVGLAIERGQGWLQVKRAAPMPLAAYFAGKLAMVLAFGVAIVGGLGLLAIAGGGVRLDAWTWARLGLTLVAGMVPFAALGLLLGVACGPNAVGPVVNLVFMAGSAASGLWMPIEALPAWWQRAAVVLPPYHYGRVALAAIGIDGPHPAGLHVAVLAGFTVVTLALAWALFSRSDERG
jgi:ABC-2 type transport system permease protein